ncbi:MAG: metalloprotease PmbA [Gammaproteobacteria bacterium]|nr:metalloprotease PmbA [Gammaproteobacteria bacterium]NNE06251.1 metalloprotease PmbA [Xanthomonadales bacterium]
MNDSSMVAQPVLDREQELDQLEAQVRTALEQAAELGADNAEAGASLQSGINVNVRLGDVETIEHHRDRSINVSVYFGRSKGHASSADLRPESVADCVRRACDIARFTQEDRCNGLADPDRLATEFPDLDLWHPRSLDVQEAIDRALECEAAGREDPRISNSEGASASSGLGLSVYGNSHGFMGRSSGTRYGQVCILIAGNGSGMQRDYWYDSRRSFDDLENPDVTGRKAAERTLARLDARQVKTGRMPVLFAPEVARGLLGHLVAAVSGGALYRNASFLRDSAGSQLFPQWLNLSEQPFIPRAAGSATFDAEGVQAVERNLVDQGVLTGYVLSSYSARRLGLESTGNAGGVHNLRQADAGEPLSSLIEDMGSGLLVTEVMGQGVSLVTGDYSRGASGFFVENGQIAYPVEEVTIAGNLRNMFSSVRALGDDLDDRANIACGSILVDGMTVAGS